MEGLIHGGAYFRNFTVFSLKEVKPSPDCQIIKLRKVDSLFSSLRHFR